MRELATAQAAMLATLLETSVPESPGLAVYHNAYRSRLRGALAEVFPRLHLWLGENAFDAVALVYIARHPSRTWTLNTFGHAFAEVLAELYPDDAEVAELAWLEWALHAAFGGEDSPAFDPAELAAADWSTVGLAFAPTLTLRPIVSNAAAIWQALAHDQTPPAVARLPQAVAMAVWRHGLEPKFRTVSLTEYEAILALRAGMSFAELCATLPQNDGEDPAQMAGSWLAEWLGDGRMVGLRTFCIGPGAVLS
ncbi:hypothetical protein ABAC460_20960 [Asticcacaulis sp. AC460]|uniref:HvfC/BufC N-terminal domain-containing protein n=1 Tax=Asticcacaulis sp. AC460 TaxID=1282360 RepID=UPI0003C3CA6D|nr:DNA-binding domain-containing protein [Asticcacaulis sp. AC460]ESQ87243.1 hypothetical protein ABAC460_20960 [Asticcacaulis sp. AC460]